MFTRLAAPDSWPVARTPIGNTIQVEAPLALDARSRTLNTPSPFATPEISPVVELRVNPGGSPIAVQLVADGEPAASAGRKLHAVPMGIE